MLFRIPLFFVIVLLLATMIDAAAKKPGRNAKSPKGGNKCPENTKTLKGSCRKESDCKKDGTASMIFCYGTNAKISGVCCKAEFD
jgi:hypothetical protein